jgi:hypothetical protein
MTNAMLSAYKQTTDSLLDVRPEVVQRIIDE